MMKTSSNIRQRLICYDLSIDPLAAFLEGPRARDATFVQVILERPWAIQIVDEAALALAAVTAGSTVIYGVDGDGERTTEPLEAFAGDVVLCRGPDHYIVADSVDSPTTIVVDPGGACRTVDGTSLVEGLRLGVRTWGNGLDGPDRMVVGTYESRSEVGRWLLDVLPPFAVMRARDLGHARGAVDLLAAEIERDAPAQEVVLDRLLDLVLVGALRAAFAAGVIEAPPWFDGAADPVVGAALRAIHEDPAAPWTVGGLAKHVGASRSLLARRFHEVVAEPPMAFLTRWRLSLAADLLLADGASVNGVAAAVGYSSPFTFSTAFKRRFGRSPRDYRNAELAATAAASH